MKKIILIFILIYSIQKYFINYNKKIYEWHCKHIYPFDKKLTEIEKKYIKYCINHSYWELFRPIYILYDPFIRRLSYMTYSHRIKNNKVNSSRIAYGSCLNTKNTYQQALLVLNEKGIQCEIIPNNNIVFGGLGWDIKRNHFKIYFRFYNYSLLENSIKELLPYMKNKCKSGILSITYHSKTNKILEKKLYCYSKDNINVNLISKFRNEIQQNCILGKKYNSKFCKKGKKLLKIYEKNGYQLDTLTYKSKNNYTMYFPT